MRKTIKLAGLIGVVLGLAFAPTASANAGDPAPTPPTPEQPTAVCTVDGTVTTPFAPTMEIGHGQYTFVTTTIVCREIANPTVQVSYNVNATGSTWGPIHAGNCSPESDPAGAGPGACAGSSTALSWSDNSSEAEVPYTNPCNETDVVNKNNISAIVAGNTASGWVKFLREGPETKAWGTFCAGSGAALGQSFIANLEFTPADPTGTYGPGDQVPYDLNGAATIY